MDQLLQNQQINENLQQNVQENAWEEEAKDWAEKNPEAAQALIQEDNKAKSLLTDKRKGVLTSIENTFELEEIQKVSEPTTMSMKSEYVESFQEKSLFKSRESKIKNKKSRLYTKNQNAEKIEATLEAQKEMRDLKAAARRKIGGKQRLHLTVEQTREISDAAWLLAEQDAAEELAERSRKGLLDEYDEKDLSDLREIIRAKAFEARMSELCQTKSGYNESGTEVTEHAKEEASFNHALDMTKLLLNENITGINLFSDEELCEHAEQMEKVMKLTKAYRSAIDGCADFASSIQKMLKGKGILIGDNTFKEADHILELSKSRLEILESMSDLYRVRKMIVTDPYYKTHYNDEISMNASETDSHEKKHLAKLLRTSYYLGKNLQKLGSAEGEDLAPGLAETDEFMKRMNQAAKGVSSEESDGYDSEYSKKLSEEHQGRINLLRKKKERDFSGIDAKIKEECVNYTSEKLLLFDYAEQMKKDGMTDEEFEQTFDLNTLTIKAPLMRAGFQNYIKEESKKIDENDPRFYSLFREYMRSKGMSDEELAEVVDVEKKTINKVFIESGDLAHFKERAILQVYEEQASSMRREVEEKYDVEKEKLNEKYAGLVQEENLAYTRSRMDLRSRIEKTLEELEFEHKTTPTEDLEINLETVHKKKITGENLFAFHPAFSAKYSEPYLAKLKIDKNYRKRFQKTKDIVNGSGNFQYMKKGKVLFSGGDNMMRQVDNFAGSMYEDLTDEELLEMVEFIKAGEKSTEKTTDEEQKMLDDMYFTGMQDYFKRQIVGFHLALNVIGDKIEFMHPKDMLKYFLDNPKINEPLSFWTPCATNFTPHAPYEFMKIHSDKDFSFMEDYVHCTNIASMLFMFLSAYRNRVANKYLGDGKVTREAREKYLQIAAKIQEKEDLLKDLKKNVDKNSDRIREIDEEIDQMKAEQAFYDKLKDSPMADMIGDYKEGDTVVDEMNDEIELDENLFEDFNFNYLALRSGHDAMKKSEHWKFGSTSEEEKEKYVRSVKKRGLDFTWRDGRNEQDKKSIKEDKKRHEGDIAKAFRKNRKLIVEYGGDPLDFD